MTHTITRKFKFNVYRILRVTFATLLVVTYGCDGKNGLQEDAATPTPDMPALFNPVVWQEKITPTPQAIRSQVVAIDIDLLRPPDNKSISLILPGGGTITAVLTRFKEIDENRFIWRGEIKGDAGGFVTFSVVNDTLVGRVITSQGKLYSIRYLAKGVGLIEELDPGRFPREEGQGRIETYSIPAAPGTPVVDPGTTTGGASDIATGAALDPATGLAREREISGTQIIASTQPNGGSGQTAAIESVQTTAENTVIDVMVLYTAAAAQFQAHPDAILGQIQLAEDDTTQSYQDSGVHQEIRVVHFQQTDYVEKSSDYLDWRTLKDERADDPHLNQVDALRKMYKADIVVLMRKPAQEGESCGQAKQMQEVDDSFCSSAFAVVPVTCATSMYSFAHELGHLMGADHNESGGTSGPPFDYSRGYIPPTNDWRTIMSYTTKDCVAATCKRTLHWSNPSLYDGTTPAPAEPKPNNALALNNTATTVAKYSEACATDTE